MSGSDLDGLAATAVEAALGAGAGDAEAYAADSTGLEIRVWGRQLESLTEAGERGLGVRAGIDGRVGYGYGTDLSEDGLREIATGAVEAARAADPDDHAGAPAGAPAAEERAGESAGVDRGPPTEARRGGDEPPELPGLSNASVAEWPTSRKVELALAAEGAALAAEGVGAVEQTVYVEESESVAIASSTGLSGAYEATSCYAFLQAHAGGDEGVETGLGFGVGRGPALLDPEAIGAEAAQRASAMIGARKPASRSCPVVLDPTVAASFIGLIGGTLCADAVQRGRSPFAERLGSEVGSAAVGITDDGLDAEGLASSPFDAEGTPRRRTPLIEDGWLRNYLHDSYTAHRAGRSSTGNAARAGYRSLPSVSSSNLLVVEGERSLEELLAEAEGGIYITDVAGLHSGVNLVTGMLSVGASGMEISTGELGAPAREFTIASDLISMLLAVRATGAESRWVPFGGSVRTPAILIGEMAIGGS